MDVVAQSHPFLDWLGGPVGVAFAWAIILLIQAATALLMNRLRQDHTQIKQQLDAHITQVEARNAQIDK